MRFNLARRFRRAIILRGVFAKVGKNSARAKYQGRLREEARTLFDPNVRAHVLRIAHEYDRLAELVDYPNGATASRP
jgi:hypothetical protein